jgi:23S rRNA (guanosine2251-2'-O)-methyltransferase
VQRIVLVDGTLSGPLERILSLALRAGIPVERKPRPVLDRISGGRHQGVVAWIERPRALELEDLLSDLPEPGLLLAFDQVTDPGNLAAALRSAAAFGAQGVLLPRRGSAGLGSLLHRRSAGAVEHVRLVQVVNLARALHRLREAGLWVVGLEPTGPPLWEAIDLRQGVVLVLGSEDRGLRRLTRGACDVCAGIPIPGPIGSLNVSVACGVALYEVLRQRRLNRVEI